MTHVTDDPRQKTGISNEKQPATVTETQPGSLQALIHLMERLRGPEGCPWDREQTWNSLIPFTIEEAYEVAEAVETGHWEHLRDELGDLLFHVVFYSRIAQEQNLFSLRDVIRGVTEKMTRRHPHVFGAAEKLQMAGQVPGRWEEIKRQEKVALARETGENAIPSVFDDINSRLPALLWAAKVQRKMGQVGFDWTDIHAVADKVREELDELDRGHQRQDQANIEEEVGDVLFTMVNLARHLKVNPETALRASTRKFQNRFRYMEERLHREGRHPRETPLDELEGLWQESKKHRP
ncbi:MAG: Nucleoside triphosphate pyrophosphohydrolase [Magnetococcales bacterium]|nr:Nucleoside triphosphate pyrophosphohydrolase [Magnetococcales bacterium]